uniref:Kinetochore-associated protein MTW1 n=1 Tax=Bionectria ochroleuca TaxID=29856 RepID=A0A8H7KEA3_BIOOC
MESQTNSDYELLTEHLGYPRWYSLLDDIINTVNVLADRALDSEAAKLEIETGTHKLETLVTASIDRNFDKLELYAMQNILTVQPRELHPYVRLAHYAGLDFPEEEQDPAAAGDKPSLESVTALRRRVQASQKLNVELRRQRDRNDALLRNLREVLGVGPDGVKREEDTSAEGAGAGQQSNSTSSSTFGFLGRGRTVLSSIGSKTPVTTTTQFTLSQLQSLRALSVSLKALLPELEAAQAAAAEDDAAPPGKRSWRRERAEYVEAASRKYLENTGGLELGSQGEVRDGEYQGQGRNLSKGDVEGLEKAVAILRNSEGRSTEAGEEPRDPS